MAARHQRVHRLLDGEQGVELGQTHGLEHEGQVGGVIGESGFGRFAVAPVDAEGDSWMLAAIDGDLLGQEHRHDGLGTGDRDVAAADARKVRDLRPHPFHVRELRAHVLDEDLARRRQPDAAGQPLEDLDAEFVLDSQDAAVERRGGDGERLGRAPDGARPDNGIDIAQRQQVTHRIPDWCKFCSRSLHY